MSGCLKVYYRDDIDVSNGTNIKVFSRNRIKINIGPPDPVHPCDFLAVVTTLVLCVIAAVGAAGKLPGPTLGWTMIGLAGGRLLFTLASGSGKKFIALTALVTAVIVAVGALGAGGILSAKQVGWGVLGTYLAGLTVKVCIRSAVPAEMRAADF